MFIVNLILHRVLHVASYLMFYKLSAYFSLYFSLPARVAVGPAPASRPRCRLAISPARPGQYSSSSGRYHGRYTLLAQANRRHLDVITRAHYEAASPSTARHPTPPTKSSAAHPHRPPPPTAAPPAVVRVVAAPQPSCKVGLLPYLNAGWYVERLGRLHTQGTKRRTARPEPRRRAGGGTAGYGSRSLGVRRGTSVGYGAKLQPTPDVPGSSAADHPARVSTAYRDSGFVICEIDGFVY